MFICNPHAGIYNCNLRFMLSGKFYEINVIVRKSFRFTILQTFHYREVEILIFNVAKSAEASLFMTVKRLKNKIFAKKLIFPAICNKKSP